MKSIILTISILFSISLMAGEITSDAVYEKIVEEYTLNEDGSMEFHYYKKLKYNTHFSFNRLYGETFIVYHPEYQTLKINVSQTTMPDGNVVEGPFNSYNEVLPRFAANAPYYNDLREMVVTHPGLDVGSVVELDYTIKTKAGFLPGLMADIVLTQSSPVNHHEIIIHVPGKKTLEYQVVNLRTGPEIEETKSGSTYTFTFNGLKENSHEAFQPADQLHQPRLYFSTLTLQEAIAFISAQDAFKYALDNSIQEQLGISKEKAKNELDLILQLQKMVSTDLNTYGIPPRYIGYNMRTPAETWNSHGGTPCEKTILLAAMLRESGIPATPMMVFPTKLYSEEKACLPLAEGIVLRVSPEEHETMYISAVKSAKQNMVFSLNGKTLVSMDPTKNNVEQIDEQFGNKVITNGDFIVNGDWSIAGKMETSLTEKSNPYYSFIKDSTYAKSLVTGGLSSKDISSAEIINSAQFRTLAKMIVDAKKPCKQLGDYTTWQIPENKNGTGSWHITYLPAERLSPFSIASFIDEEYSYNITLPGETVLINPLETIEKETEFGKLVLSTKQNGNKVVVKRMLVIKKTQISQEEYPDFKEMMDLWNEKNFKKLVLKGGQS